ncbi:Ldh family oxidoreductase [Dankookia sp. P2]|uniref:Ldh family oxidoreductase n=1 Tax=Dankookia sp. P2 TaxID=3423955 RepID=UPI003D67E5CA
MNGIAMALDPAAFGDAAAFGREVDALSEEVAAAPAAEGTTLLLPGERGAGVMRARQRDGIPLPLGTWKRLAEAARILSVPMPATVQA